ncbi:MAG: amidohydrolase [Nannocystaceae bacterium]
MRFAAFACVASTFACGPKPTASVPPAAAPVAAEPTTDPDAPPAISAAAPPLLLRGARVMTATGVIYERGDVLMRDGKIEAVAAKLDAPAGVSVLDVSGKTVTPGIIDTHSHIGVYASPGWTAHSDGNEMSGPTKPEVRAADGYWPQDPQIDLARAAGVTTMQILPGSANLIGGRSVVVRPVPGARSIDDAKFVGAPSGLKMACGENPKRVYGEKGGPVTRMGNMAGFRTAFQKATEYRRKHEHHRAHADDEDAGPPPERDLGMETLAGVLAGDILVHNHCYRADEMLGMLALADEFGFEIRSFHHAVEAYKIADRLAEAGVSASVWADWWGFKAEAFDTTRANAAILSAAGARAIIHSDSAQGIQRLNQEAAKAKAAGERAGLNISEDEALRWVTANAAWALGIHETTGTLEPGKMADVVVWSGDPLSVYTRTEKVYMEGALVFDRDDPDAHHTDFEVGIPSAAGDVQ